MKSKLQKVKEYLKERRLFPGEKYYGLGDKAPLKDKGEGLGPGASEMCKGVWKISTQPVETQTPGYIQKLPLGSCVQGPRMGLYTGKDPDKAPLNKKPKPIFNRIKALARKRR